MRKTSLLLWFVTFLAVAVSAAAAQKNQPRTIVGRVFSSQNEPLAKAVVYLKNTKSLNVKTYITNSDGDFHFPALFPDVDYEIYAAFDGARSDTKTISAFDSHKEVNVTLRIHTHR